MKIKKILRVKIEKIVFLYIFHLYMSLNQKYFKLIFLFLTFIYLLKKYLLLFF